MLNRLACSDGLENGVRSDERRLSENFRMALFCITISHARDEVAYMPAATRLIQ